MAVVVVVVVEEGERLGCSTDLVMSLKIIHRSAAGGRGTGWWKSPSCRRRLQPPHARVQSVALPEGLVEVDLGSSCQRGNSLQRPCYGATAFKEPDAYRIYKLDMRRCHVK